MPDAPKPTAYADFPAFDLVPSQGENGIILLCDHAKNTVPFKYGTLGLPDSEFERHIAYDIGAEDLTRGLAEALGAPAVLSTFSRLLIDPNRGEDDPTIVMRLSDGTVVPGNHPISPDEIQTRIDCYHAPYHDAIDHEIDRVLALGLVPMIFSIHSFTPAWKGIARPWEVGFLWDLDDRLPNYMIQGMQQQKELTVGDNEPYDGALKNDTMYRHATVRGLAQALLEVRQDLICTPDGVAEWVERLAPLLSLANQLPQMHEIKHFGSRMDAPLNPRR